VCTPFDSTPGPLKNPPRPRYIQGRPAKCAERSEHINKLVPRSGLATLKTANKREAARAGGSFRSAPSDVVGSVGTRPAEEEPSVRLPEHRSSSLASSFPSSCCFTSLEHTHTHTPLVWPTALWRYYYRLLLLNSPATSTSEAAAARRHRAHRQTSWAGNQSRVQHPSPPLLQQREREGAFCRRSCVKDQPGGYPVSPTLPCNYPCAHWCVTHSTFRILFQIKNKQSNKKNQTTM